MPKEKSGHTETIKYDFNTIPECQVQLDNGKWYRATPLHFRSFNGPRRFVRYPEGEPVYEEYDGALYYWNTNTKVKEPIGKGVQYIESMPRITQIRPHERHLLDHMP
jgi:hypothetical protein